MYISALTISECPLPIGYRSSILQYGCSDAFWAVSTESVVGLLTAQNFRVRALVTSCLRCSKLLFCVSSQCHSVSPSCSFLNGALMSDKLGMNLTRCWIIQMNLSSSCLLCDGGSCVTTLTFSSSGLSPLALNVCQMYSISLVMIKDTCFC